MESGRGTRHVRGDAGESGGGRVSGNSGVMLVATERAHRLHRSALSACVQCGWLCCAPELRDARAAAEQKGARPLSSQQRPPR